MAYGGRERTGTIEQGRVYTPVNSGAAVIEVRIVGEFDDCVARFGKRELHPKETCNRYAVVEHREQLFYSFRIDRFRLSRHRLSAPHLHCAAHRTVQVSANHKSNRLRDTREFKLFDSFISSTLTDAALVLALDQSGDALSAADAHIRQPETSALIF